MKWKKLKQWWQRYYQRVSLVPYDDAPIIRWQEFSEKAPRWLVEETCAEWEKEFYVTHHWAAVHDALRYRCDHFENPVLSQKFLDENKNQIFWVGCGSTNEAIIQEVWRKMDRSPLYVVELSGKLRGIAVFKGLVIAGVLNSNYRHGEISRIHQLNQTRPLKRRDAIIVAEYLPQICHMMQNAGIPILQGNYWLGDDKEEALSWNSDNQEYGVLNMAQQSHIIGML